MDTYPQKILACVDVMLSMDNKSLFERLLLLGGAIGATIGCYLPWVRLNPALGPDAEVPSVHLAGMDPGFSAVEIALLALVVATVAWQRFGTNRTRSSTAAVWAGGATLVFCANYLSSDGLIGFGATFVPDVGWFVTVIAGVLLVSAGGVRLFTSPQAPAPDVQ